jgi:hypothetical protein
VDGLTRDPTGMYELAIRRATANGFANQRKRKSVKRRLRIGALIAARGPYWGFAAAGAGTRRLLRSAGAVAWLRAYGSSAA